MKFKIDEGGVITARGVLFFASEATRYSMSARHFLEEDE